MDVKLRVASLDDAKAILFTTIHDSNKTRQFTFLTVPSRKQSNNRG